MGALYSILLIDLLLKEKTEADLLIPLFDSRILLEKHFILKGKSGDYLVLLEWKRIG
jgi:hypothetical protein